MKSIKILYLTLLIFNIHIIEISLSDTINDVPEKTPVLTDPNSVINSELKTRNSSGTGKTPVELENARKDNNNSEAIRPFEELYRNPDTNSIGIPYSRNFPQPIYDFGAWGADIRIGNRPNVYDCSLDIHRASGNLFAVLTYNSGPVHYWSLNYSTDRGASWEETYYWLAVDEIPMISIAVVDSHCYVAYIPDSPPTSAKIRRFRADDGSSERFGNGASYIEVITAVSPDSIKEIALASGQDYMNRNLYYFVITTNGRLRCSIAEGPDFIDWTELPTHIYSADRGLDASANERFSTYFIWASFIDRDDNLNINAGSMSSWDFIQETHIGSTSNYTAISAYNDSVMCVFENAGVPNHCRMGFSPDGGYSWYWRDVDNHSATTDHPDVTVRKGGGAGIIYRYYTTPRRGRSLWFGHRSESRGPFDYADYPPISNRPSIEYLGDGIYGVVYIGLNRQGQGVALFDRNYHSNRIAIHIFPDNPPVTVPAGGSFTFTGVLVNQRNYHQTTDLVIGLSAPDSCLYGPIHRIDNVQLEPNDTLILPGLTQVVPGFIPFGTYNYIAACGNHPSKVISYDTFPVNVIRPLIDRTGNRTSVESDNYHKANSYNNNRITLKCHPNPFNIRTCISYYLTSCCEVTLDIYNLLGEKIVTPVSGLKPAGANRAYWNASDYSSGIYFIRLTAGNKKITRRVVLLK